jgi:hypothetical protein
LVRIAIGQGNVKADLSKEFDGPVSVSALTPPRTDSHYFFNRLPHLHTWIQRRTGILKDDLNSVAHSGQ